jgi:hypothetical protein
MAFDYDVANPGDSSYIADFPQNERDFRTDALGAMDVEHHAETTGRHRQVSMVPLGADPSSVLTNGFVYTKDVGGITELFYMDENEKVIQLTDDGSASPDKVAIDGDEMTGHLDMTGTAMIRLLNLVTKIQTRNAADDAWWSALFLDDSDKLEVGDILSDGVRLLGKAIDDFVVKYGAGDKLIWHSGNFASAPIITEVFDSDLIVMTDAAASGSEAHGIGAKPTFWWVELECIEAEEGYEIGDCIVHSPGMVDSGTPRGIICAANDTNLEWRKTAAEIVLPQADGTGNFTIDEDKWKFRVLAGYTA